MAARPLRVVGRPPLSGIFHVQPPFQLSTDFGEPSQPSDGQSRCIVWPPDLGSFQLTPRAKINRWMLKVGESGGRPTSPYGRPATEFGRSATASAPLPT